ncbi:alcohol dehydrogenase [Sphingomonas sp. YR710]|uniref:alcohol dehydrogenase catalytic domain-containing protein n=1 Tax=Sphingomonas sp. YR710 TaxID=1882773 RepID=UPI000883ABCA|nr:alcohol dehydrogenase catalytic domain-containing protein [Sphingomonas sp. YR710]SDC47607.1 alcohol dehydrogenase [Sphingomonas sp. YR710]
MPKMIAMAVLNAGGQLERIERDIPAPGGDELLIEVHACGVCHSDSLTVEGYIPIQYPRVPGHEVIGTVAAVGANVSGWQIGDRAGVGWFGGSCGYCARCRRGDAFACETVQAVTGVTRDGGYATHMIAAVSAVAHVPADLDAIESAPLLCAGITTFNALRNCGAGAGDLVAVHGVGGLGHLGIQFARRLGFRTVAVNRGRDKEALARSLGAHDYIDSDAGDVAEALQRLGGARAIIATVTSADAMQAIVGGLGPNGMMMVIGAVGAFPVDTLGLLGKRAAVKGWYSGVAADSEDTLAFSQLNDVTSMNEVYPFEEAQVAYERMMSGKARFRVVLKMR